MSDMRFSHTVYWQFVTFNHEETLRPGDGMNINLVHSGARPVTG